jgi:methylglutamate dehydrogenase subunit D
VSDALSMPPRRRSPFTSHAVQARPDASGGTGVHLLATMLPGVTQVSTWISGLAVLEAALHRALGCAPPARTGLVVASPLGTVLRTGPEEFLILSGDGARTEAALRLEVTPEIGAVLDLTHARSRIRITGERCLDTLAKLYALDMRADAFPVGEARLSGHHHVPCLLHRVEPECFDLIIFTTYALDQLEAIEDAALEYGVAVELRDD